jgi:ABC-type sugar transport system permease subunit
MSHLRREPVALIVTLLTFGVLLYFVAYPLYAVFRESVMDDSGKFVGLANYVNFLTSEYFRGFHYTLSPGVATVAVLIGLVFAYG